MCINSLEIQKTSMRGPSYKKAKAKFQQWGALLREKICLKIDVWGTKGLKYNKRTGTGGKWSGPILTALKGFERPFSTNGLNWFGQFIYPSTDSSPLSIPSTNPYQLQFELTLNCKIWIANHMISTTMRWNNIGSL